MVEAEAKLPGNLRPYRDRGGESPDNCEPVIPVKEGPHEISCGSISTKSTRIERITRPIDFPYH